LTRNNDNDVDLLQGTLDLLVLKAVSLGPLHGYGVLLRIQQISGDRLEIRQASLYPALYRIEHEGWIAGEWGESENKRRARYYKLTAAGRRRLDAEAKKWNQFVDLMGSILKVSRRRYEAAEPHFDMVESCQPRPGARSADRRGTEVPH
jgi:transcriptional regulator